MSIWWIFPFAAIASLFLTGVLRRYALARCLLDTPNERTSHSVPTPRGGGVAIVLAFIAGLPLLAIAGALPTALLWGLLGGGVWVALVGFWDDHGHIAARWRLLAHFLAAGWALTWIGGLPALSAGGFILELGLLGNLLAMVYLVWLLNLYNFMDGIDGIAGIEAMTVSFGGAVLYALAPLGGYAWATPLLLLASVAGFLFWNYPPAKIFMGDAGSGFLGLILGVLSLQAAWVAPPLFWGWVILLGAFIVDATVTLFRRVMRGEKFYEAHRSHAYQYASRRHGAHKPISLAFGAINLFWLLPIAALVAMGHLDGAIGVLIAYGPLIWAAYRYKAGARQLQEV